MDVNGQTSKLLVRESLTFRQMVFNIAARPVICDHQVKSNEE